MYLILNFEDSTWGSLNFKVDLLSRRSLPFQAADTHGQLWRESTSADACRSRFRGYRNVHSVTIRLALQLHAGHLRLYGI